MSTVRVKACGRPGTLRRVAWIVFGVVVVALAPVASAQLNRAKSGELAWRVLQRCTLLTNDYFDGDSFHVMCQSGDERFRLYFVDAPETDTRFSDRVAEQAAEFGISNSDVLRAGEMAKEFTRRWLASGRFDVLTRRESAMGLGSPPRIYAVVLMGKNNLAEALVTHGWARIHGTRANWPGGPGSAEFIRELEKLEAVAKKEKRGVWNDRDYKRVAAAPKAPAAKPAPRTAAGKLDLNTASKEELDRLPDIGPKRAEAIIAHRPYQSVDDLEKVPDIGEKRMKKLRPMVTVSKR